MIVVADTSPLNYLIEIGSAHLLPEMYGRVSIPPAVLMELRNPRARPLVRSFMNQTPEWLSFEPLIPDGSPIKGLDPGESEAIQLAHEMDADLVLMDERFGVRIARSQGLNVTGTLGVLVEASRINLVDIRDALRRLEATRFRCTPGLLESTIRLAGK